MLTLKIELSVILPAKGVYSEIEENTNLRQASYGKTIGKSGEQGSGILYWWKAGSWEGLL